MTTTIAPERPDTPAAFALIAALDDYLTPMYPAESRHGYSVDKLIYDDVAFFVTRCDDTPAGCGGVQIFESSAEGDPTYGELKRMYVRPEFRGRGLAKAMIRNIEGYLRYRRISLMRLETGIHQHEAIELYEGAGFVEMGPFGDYCPDRNSRFYEKCLP